MKAQSQQKSGIVYACYCETNREGEHFVPEHTLSYQIAGSLLLNDGRKEYLYKEGSFRLIRRNQLLKFVKKPPVNGDYESLTLYFDQEFLKKFSSEYSVSAADKIFKTPVVSIETKGITENFINSLLAYYQSGLLNNPQFMDLKLKEGLSLILLSNPELKNILFDFNDPHKIDLESFMNRNYRFNVNLERFAYLTGRSLATFKRDFQSTFNVSPRNWLQQKRLQEAHYLIGVKHKKPSEVYLEVGFEDLSHFSQAFKKQFGYNPTQASRLT